MAELWATQATFWALPCCFIGTTKLHAGVCWGVSWATQTQFWALPSSLASYSKCPRIHCCANKVLKRIPFWAVPKCCICYTEPYPGLPQAAAWCPQGKFLMALGLGPRLRETHRKVLDLAVKATVWQIWQPFLGPGELFLGPGQPFLGPGELFSGPGMPDMAESQ